MSAPDLVLSLFPGIGLLDLAFEQEGFQIVRGPDILWGGDVRRFHVPPGVFAGVIGGPPCQKFSRANELAEGADALDLIPEFVRIVREACPRWVVMENVGRAAGNASIPADWMFSRLRDYDCGGATHRERLFWTWPFMLLAPPRAGGDAAHSVMASTWRRGRSGGGYVTDKNFLPGDLPIAEYARLQGAEEIGARLVEHRAGRAFAVHVLGNGVPLPMGRFIARSVRAALNHPHLKP